MYTATPYMYTTTPSPLQEAASASSFSGGEQDTASASIEAPADSTEADEDPDLTPTEESCPVPPSDSADCPAVTQEPVSSVPQTTADPAVMPEAPLTAGDDERYFDNPAFRADCSDPINDDISAETTTTTTRCIREKAVWDLSDKVNVYN